ncbi:MAG: oxidoreductase [Planctomycetaceae bacterium]|nr:oxidoreductase [Planctomycetaceae bacterium]|tara:strand:+ start:3123 stop:3803 length:681 start_codon:yes stop_codon:yes gene_type:complete
MSKHIVVTGCSQGLGLALIEGFISAGHTVSGCSRNSLKMQELNDQFGEAHYFTDVDVSSAPHVNRWAEACLEKSGPVDLVINNAAIINPNANMWEIEDEQWSQLVDINIKGVFYVCKAFLPSMIANSHGVLVNISSGWGRSAAAEVSTYCCSKWAVEGLTRSLAQEVPAGIAAIPLNPGIIHTSLLESCFGSSASQFPSPQQWAQDAVPFLLGLNADDNGQPLTVN